MTESEETRLQGLTALHNVNRRSSGVVGKQKIKNNLLDYFHPSESDLTNKKVSKSTQVNSTWITEEDISSDVPSEHFWQNVAEKRRVALQEALGENERLCKLHESLTVENDQYKTLLEEASTFVDVFKVSGTAELVQDNADDTGIDVGDLNTSADTE